MSYGLHEFIWISVKMPEKTRKLSKARAQKHYLTLIIHWACRIWRAARNSIRKHTHTPQTNGCWKCAKRQSRWSSASRASIHLHQRINNRRNFLASRFLLKFVEMIVWRCCQSTYANSALIDVFRAIDSYIFCWHVLHSPKKAFAAFQYRSH